MSDKMCFRGGSGEGKNITRKFAEKERGEKAGDLLNTTVSSR
jgi:hypothetical protein